MTRLVFVFQPWSVLLCSLLVASAYAGYMLRSSAIRSTMFEPSGSFMYVVPIVVPFVAFLFDRAERLWTLNKLHHVMDVIIVATAMGRVVGNVPLISGHTLFLTYAILTSRSVVVRITAVLVMAQAMYLKYCVWHDWVTSTSGIVLGSLAAFIVSRAGHKSDHFENSRVES